MEKFSFDTINDFDNHIIKSIPNYDILFSSIKSISEYFFCENTNVYDLGCSTGKLLKSINNNCNKIGYDIANLLPKEEGFYEVVDPQYDPVTEKRGDLYLEGNKYYYIVEAKTWTQTLSELKESKIKHLKDDANLKLKETDWYYIRKLDRGIDVPQEIEDERAIIINNINDHEIAINNLTKKQDVVKYEFR